MFLVVYVQYCIMSNRAHFERYECGNKELLRFLKYFSLTKNSYRVRISLGTEIIGRLLVEYTSGEAVNSEPTNRVIRS